MPDITIQKEVCTGCGACVELCSVTHVFAMEDRKAQVLSPSRCWDCGQCVGVCPVDAITHSSFPLDKCPLLADIPGGEGALPAVFQARRSVRVYKDKAVPRNMIEDLVSAARWAPSGRNMQAVQWLALDDRKTIDQLATDTIASLSEAAVDLRRRAKSAAGTHEQRLALLEAKTFEHLHRRWKKGEMPLFFGAPVVMFAITPRSDFGRDDAVISGYSMQLAALQKGLATCQIGYFILAQKFKNNLGKDILPIPEDHMVQMVMTAGYSKYSMRRSVHRDPVPLSWV